MSDVVGVKKGTEEIDLPKYESNIDLRITHKLVLSALHLESGDGSVHGVYEK